MGVVLTRRDDHSAVVVSEGQPVRGRHYSCALEWPGAGLRTARIMITAISGTHLTSEPD